MIESVIFARGAPDDGPAVSKIPASGQAGPHFWHLLAKIFLQLQLFVFLGFAIRTRRLIAIPTV